ncbi:hypothetical protein QVD17_05994 [Tagetes erecta]|uniref:Uncharacterized protein n=1 Tax=Tagetes erecta TaxID=13708 RepID=A0AAD8LG31_TARER|nr:hypothetical protein QVD17_05994 [Tagetes erecta]
MPLPISLIFSYNFNDLYLSFCSPPSSIKPKFPYCYCCCCCNCVDVRLDLLHLNPFNSTINANLTSLFPSTDANLISSLNSSSLYFVIIIIIIIISVCFFFTCCVVLIGLIEFYSLI